MLKIFELYCMKLCAFKFQLIYFSVITLLFLLTVSKKTQEWYCISACLEQTKPKVNREDLFKNITLECSLLFMCSHMPLWSKRKFDCTNTVDRLPQPKKIRSF